MIIYCDSSGNVSSIPSTVPFGAILDDVTIIAPKTTAMAMLKIKPPSGKLLEPIFCSKDFTFDKERDIVYKAIFPSDVTNKAGRAEYQIVFTMQDGKQQPTFAGSFNIARGVEVDLPETGDDLGAHSLDDILRMLTNATALYENVNNLQIDLENVSKTVGTDDAITLPDVFDSVIDGLRKIYTAIGNELLQTSAQNIVQAINEVFGHIIEYKAVHNQDYAELGGEVHETRKAIGIDDDQLIYPYKNIYDALRIITENIGDFSRIIGIDDDEQLPAQFTSIINGLVLTEEYLTNNKHLNTLSKDVVEAINEVANEVGLVRGEIGELEDVHTSIMTKHTRDIETINANINRIFSIIGEQPITIEE